MAVKYVGYWLRFKIIFKEKESFCLKHGQLLSRRTTSTGSVENGESPMGHYCNDKYEKRHNGNNNTKYEQDSEKKETDLKIVTKIDKITKFVYPTAYIIFNIVYWYKLKD